MTSSKIQVGDLVKVEPWDCEGIEPPWGWTSSGNVIGMTSREVRSGLRKKISPGSNGLVIDRSPHTEEDNDPHCVLVVDGKKLNVPSRFIHKIES